MSSPRRLWPRSRPTQRSSEQRWPVRRVLPVLPADAVLALHGPADRLAVRRHQRHPSPDRADAAVDGQPDLGVDGADARLQDPGAAEHLGGARNGASARRTSCLASCGCSTSSPQVLSLHGLRKRAGSCGSVDALAPRKESSEFS